MSSKPTQVAEHGLTQDQAIVDLNLAMLRDQGFELTKDHRILEFGCGSGRHVYEWRDRGFAVYGFDVADYADLRQPEDRSLFAFSPKEFTYEIRFPDESFDYVCSTSVFEHVMDYDAAFREIARVLKPGGLSIHVFPARWRPIEPHIYVPFGARFHSWWFYRFWAMTGIRNEFQQGMSAAEAAERNWIYARTGINYPTKREILFFARRHFDSAYFAEKSYIRFTKRSSRVSRLFDRAISLHSGFERLYRDVHTRVLVVKKKS